MPEGSQPIIVRPADRSQDANAQTDGMIRETAFSTEDLWVGVVTTAPGEMSAWHHHGDHETYAYVATGSKHIEFGPGGNRSIVAGPGDLIHIPKGMVHREGNPSAETSRSIAFRLGRGPVTVNVQGPPQGGSPPSS